MNVSAVMGIIGFAIEIVMIFLGRSMGMRFLPSLYLSSFLIALVDTFTDIVQGAYIAGVIQGIEAFIFGVLFFDEWSKRKRRKARELGAKGRALIESLAARLKPSPTPVPPGA
jgi:L-lactate permease